jgi:hypothetical protein
MFIAEHKQAWRHLRKPEDPHEAEEHAVEEYCLEEQPKRKQKINEPLDWI